jgi:RNA polymerase sigma-70 factor (ECF subfamily)
MREKIVGDAVEPLVYKIALNLARSALRRRKILKWMPLGPVTPEPAIMDDQGKDLAQKEERSQVHSAVLALPDDLRKVILLCEFTELTYGQIGNILEIPEGTVGSRRNRALQLLRSSLE